jgi:hypothetical protein
MSRVFECNKNQGLARMSGGRAFVLVLIILILDVRDFDDDEEDESERTISSV